MNGDVDGRPIERRMKRLRNAAVLAAPCALFISLSAPSTALACGATPCAQRSDVMPENGAQAVPTNTELRVLYLGTLSGQTLEGRSCELPLAKMRLVTEAGDPLALEASAEQAGETELWMVARPAASLMPRTRYALELRTSEDGNDCACDETRSWTQVSAFTTGETADSEAPRFAGSVQLTSEGRFDSSSTCGQIDGFAVDAALTPAEDASPDIRYDVFVNGTLATRYVADLSEEIFVDCGSTALMTSTVIRSDADIEVRAVDAAGNASPEIAAELRDVSCKSGAAGSPRGDAAVSSDGGSSSAAAGASGDCAISPRRATVAPGALVFVLALALCARRRLRH